MQKHKRLIAVLDRFWWKGVTTLPWGARDTSLILIST